MPTTAQTPIAPIVTTIAHRIDGFDSSLSSGVLEDVVNGLPAEARPETRDEQELGARILADQQVIGKGLLCIKQRVGVRRDSLPSVLRPFQPLAFEHATLDVVEREQGQLRTAQAKAIR
jgi:hypothetical protein